MQIMNAEQIWSVTGGNCETASISQLCVALGGYIGVGVTIVYGSDTASAEMIWGKAAVGAVVGAGLAWVVYNGASVVIESFL